MLNILIPIITVVLFFNYFLVRDVAYPPFIQSFLWLVLLIAFSFFQLDFFEVDSYVYSAVFFAVIGFSFGGALVCLKTGRKYGVFRIAPHPSYEIALNSLTFLAILILPLFLLRIYNIAGSSFSFDLFYRLREGLIENDGEKMFGIGYYFYFCALLFSFRFIVANKILTIKNFLSFLLPLIVAILFVAKGFLLFLLCCAVGAQLIQRKTNGTRVLLISTFVLIVLMFLFIFLRQMGQEDEALGLSAVLKVYFLAGLPALTELLSSSDGGAGEYVFRNVFVWLNRFGFNLPIVPIVQEFVAVPFGTNVFTYLRPYILDFGVGGVFLFNVFFGFLSGFIYSRARDGSPFYIVMYGVTLYPLIIQFFDDQYFQLLSLWFYISIFLFLFFRFSKYTLIKLN